MDECWLWPRGLVKKASMVMAGLISMDANAIEAIVEGEESLKSVSKYWAWHSNLTVDGISGCKDTKPIVLKCSSPALLNRVLST